MNTCAYCGKTLIKTNKTRDHIPPKGFFTKEERTKFQPITVPACKQCNNGSKVQDENAKHILNLCVPRMRNQTQEQTELHRKMLQKNNRLRQMIEGSKPILIQDSMTGAYTSEKLITPDKNYIIDTENVLRRIARGLYWHHFQKILNADKYTIEFSVGFDSFNSAKITSEARKKKLKYILYFKDTCKRVDLLPDVFTYWIGKTIDHEYASAFLMQYRKSVLVTILAFSN
jgi:hypothetical protein